MTTLPEPLTYGAILDLARAVTTPEDGALLLGALVRRAQNENPALSDDEALAMQRSNLGYLAGYCDVATQRRFERMFGAVHPVFGPVGGPNEPKTVAETIAMGRALAGEQLRALTQTEEPNDG